MKGRGTVRLQGTRRPWLDRIRGKRRDDYEAIQNARFGRNSQAVESQKTPSYKYFNKLII
jgi:hypothetical protein